MIFEKSSMRFQNCKFNVIEIFSCHELLRNSLEILNTYTSKIIGLIPSGDPSNSLRPGDSSSFI